MLANLPTASGIPRPICAAVTILIGIATRDRIREAKSHDGSSKDVLHPVMVSHGRNWIRNRFARDLVQKAYRVPDGSRARIYGCRPSSGAAWLEP